MKATALTLPILSRCVLAATVSLGAATGAGAEGSAAMQQFLDQSIRPLAEAPVVIDAVRAQNALTASYDQGQIDALDQAWRAEIGAAATPSITPVVENPAADFLRARIEAERGVIAEAFVMDARGLNVAASGATSDFWQGDEAKFSETYPKGPGAAHFGDVEFDESTGLYEVQISVTVTDPQTGAPIGAMTVGVNAEALN